MLVLIRAMEIIVPTWPPVCHYPYISFRLVLTKNVSHVRQPLKQVWRTGELRCAHCCLRWWWHQAAAGRGTGLWVVVAARGSQGTRERAWKETKGKQKKKNETTLSSSKTDSTFISFSEHPYFLLFHPKLCLAAPSLPFLFPILLNLSLLPLKK